MRWGMIKIKSDLCSECTSMQRKRSCYIDGCQGALHVVKSEDLRTFMFFCIPSANK